MWYNLIFNSVLFTLSTSLRIIDQHQNQYLKKFGIKCGVVTKDKNEQASSRIVNANPSENTYSWMVHVILKLYADENISKKNNPKYGMFDAAGAMISDKAVITCGHCICNDVDATEHFPYLLTCGEENPKGKSQNNLNIKGRNEINVSYGKRTRIRVQDTLFNDNIKAYVYKYEKNKEPLDGWTIRRNKGDIGIIITKVKIDLAREKIVPICLPTPDTFETKSGIDVKFVGWGARGRIKMEPTGDVTSYACFTNGAREPDKKLYPSTEGLSIVSCDFSKAEAKFCLGGQKDSEGFNQHQITTFSYKTRIKFNENMVDYIEKDIFYEKCVEYMKVAEKKWVEAKKYTYPDETYAGIQRNKYLKICITIHDIKCIKT